MLVATRCPFCKWLRGFFFEDTSSSFSIFLFLFIVEFLFLVLRTHTCCLNSIKIRRSPPQRDFIVHITTIHFHFPTCSGIVHVYIRLSHSCASDWSFWWFFPKIFMSVARNSITCFRNSWLKLSDSVATCEYFRAAGGHPPTPLIANFCSYCRCHFLFLHLTSSPFSSIKTWHGGVYEDVIRRCFLVAIAFRLL